MNLSRAGRIALFVNLALSLVFAFWAFALWYNRIDFEAEKKKRDEIIASISKTISPGETALEGARLALNRVEMQRPALAAWYQKELENLRAGSGEIKALYFEKGELKFDPQGHPMLGPILDASNQEIKVQGSLKELDTKYQSVDAAIKKTLQESESTVKEISKLTEQIGDGKQPGAGQPAGLRFQWASWQLAEKRSINEQEFVKPLLYNRMVELEILKKRHNALEARLKEVEGAAVTQT